MFALYIVSRHPTSKPVVCDRPEVVVGKWDLDALTKRIHGAIRPGGNLVNFQDGMTPKHTRPDTTLDHLANQLIKGIHYSLDRGSLADADLQCGFRWVQSRTIDTPMGPINMGAV